MENTHFESLYPPDTRYKEIAELISFIKTGNSCQIIAFPGVGRSNLLRLLPYNRNLRIKHLGENQKWFHFVTADFSEIRRRSLTDATKFLFLSLVDSLRERKMTGEYEAVNKIFKESLIYPSNNSLRHPREDGDPINKQENVDSRFRGNDTEGSGNDRIQLINDELILFQGLKKAIDFLAIEKELTVVYFFDRFEEYVPMLTPDFFSNLRVLRNRAKYRFSVVFSLNRPLEDLLEPTLFADFYEFLAGHTIYLSVIDKAGLDFRVSYLEKVTGKKIDKKVLDEIISLTGGHGKLMRTALEAILASNKFEAQNPKSETNSNKKNTNDQKVSNFDIRISDLTGFLLEQKAVRGSLFEIWQSLTPSEQKTLSSVILSETKNLMKEKRDPSVSGKAGFPQDDNVYLKNSGLIEDNKITIPLFETFVKSQSTIQQFSNSAIVFDPNTNEIKKGDVILSDQLTSSEFKLLKFLIQNSDRIIDREEIIQAVWKESASTAGVTEQALDQLIFRLRKKLEENPNEPHHIITIKGRGLKFSA